MDFRPHSWSSTDRLQYAQSIQFITMFHWKKLDHSHGANVRPPFVTAKNATQDTWMARPRYRSSGHCKAEMTRSVLILGRSDRSRAFFLLSLARVPYPNHKSYPEFGLRGENGQVGWVLLCFSAREYASFRAGPLSPVGLRHDAGFSWSVCVCARIDGRCRAGPEWGDMSANETRLATPQRLRVGGAHVQTSNSFFSTGLIQTFFFYRNSVPRHA